MCFTNDMNSRNTQFKLGGNTINITETCVYAGILMCSNKIGKQRTQRAANKARQLIHSLKDIGLNTNGLNPLSSVIVWQRVILPSALYGCELWGQLARQDTETLERTQRHFARYVQGIDKRSPIESTTSTLGLLLICSYIHKQRLFLFGRLCRTPPSSFHKHLFLSQISQYVLGYRNICTVTFGNCIVDRKSH